jgi:hypothetical protein
LASERRLLVGDEPDLAHRGLGQDVGDLVGDREAVDVPAVVGEALFPGELAALHVEDLLGVENQVEDRLEARMAKLAPVADALAQFVEISFE